MAGVGEGFPAFLAGVRPLARVDPHVLLQVASGRPALAANRAHVRPLAGMLPHVHVEAGQRGEIFGTVGAAIRSLAAVRPQVALQPVAGLEAFAALRAQEATVFVVTRPVGLKARERGVRLVALVAAVRARRVRALVDAEQSHACGGSDTVQQGQRTVRPV